MIEKRDILGYPSVEAHSNGLIWSKRPRKYLKGILGGGYYRVHLGKNPNRKLVAVHSLIAEAFIGPRPSGLEINHKDGNKLNNIPDNLEYVTKSENAKHSYRLGLQRKDGINHHMSKLTDMDVLIIRALHNNGTLLKDIASLYPCSPSTIRDVIRRRTWIHI